MLARPKQVLITLLAIISLDAAAFGGCACIDHQRSADDVTGCHDHAGTGMMGGNDDHATSVAGECVCSCTEHASELSARSAFIKHQQQAPWPASDDTRLTIALDRDFGSSRIDFAKPFYLSDSFYDLAPNRGPPLS